MLENFSVQQIISKIKNREIKIAEVVNFYLDRIKKFNPKLNAIISHIDETKITEEAKLKDENFNSDNYKDDIRCNYDGGDCCDQRWISDGYCTNHNNFASCFFFDGGDCL